MGGERLYKDENLDDLLQDAGEHIEAQLWSVQVHYLLF